MAYLAALPAPAQAFLATLVTYLFTLFGAALVLFFRRPRPFLLDALLGLGAGIMLASAFWSLLEPGIDLARQLGQPPALICAAGFLCGSAFLLLGDLVVSHRSAAPCISGSARRVRMMIVSITLHNIPEGLAVGVAFGALSYACTSAALRSAWLLALGIALQNFPEGAAVSLPLLREKYTPRQAFRIGHLSGVVEPIAGLIGAVLASAVQQLLPFLLSFAGGAMILVVATELLPECQKSLRPLSVTLLFLAGFAAMMVLDVAFA